MEERVDEIIGVGIVRVPAPDGEVPLAAALQLEVLGHRLVQGTDPVPGFAEGVRELLEESGELAEENRVDGGRQLEASRETVASIELSEAARARTRGFDSSAEPE